MKNNIVWAAFLFLIQPVLIIGIVATFFNYKKRVEYSRKKFRVNFIRNNFELKDFLLKGLLPGLITSGIIIGLGIPLTIEWYLIYQLAVIILLLISGLRFIHPIFTFPLTVIAFYVMKYLNYNFKFSKIINKLNSEIFLTNFKPESISQLSLNILVLSMIILFLTTLFMKNKDYQKHFPFMKNSNRGKSIATYQNKLFWLMPVVVLVPGNIISPWAPWWPVLEIGTEKYAILLLPILIGFHYFVSTQFIEEASVQIKKDFQKLGLMSLVLLVGAYFYRKMVLPVAVLLLLGSLFILYRHYQREKSWTFKYGPVDKGVRIISVRPDSPAERMGLVIGDIILEMNNHPVNSQKEFDEIIAYNRSYITMRLERKDGEIILVETPLYDDDFNNLGLLILEG